MIICCAILEEWRYGLFNMVMLLYSFRILCNDLDMVVFHVATMR
jgi:hypothetical protein